MPNLDETHQAIDRTILSALFDLLPDDWDAFRMTVAPMPGRPDGLVIGLRNPAKAGASVAVSDALRKGVEQLVAYLAAQGRHWDALIYAGQVDSSGEWRMTVTVPLPAA